MRLQWFLCSLCIILALVGCSGNKGEVVVATAVSGPEATSAALAAAIRASAEPPVDVIMLQQNLEEAESLWQAQNVTRYSIEVNYGKANIDFQTLSLTVENGQVIDSKQTCYPPKTCVLQNLIPQEFTIENLFNVARNLIALRAVENMTFNETYGYPDGITSDDVYWSTNAFQVLAP